MELSRPGVRLRLIGLALALCTVAGVGAACAPATVTPAATAAATTAPTQTTAPAASATQPTAAQPVEAAVISDKEYSQDPAPSAAVSPASSKVRHFMGDANAPVVIVEISDFQ